MLVLAPLVSPPVNLLVAFLHCTNLQCLLQDLADVVHGLHWILAHVRKITIATELLDSIVGSVTHLLHLLLIQSSYDEFEQVKHMCQACEMATQARAQTGACGCNV